MLRLRERGPKNQFLRFGLMTQISSPLAVMPFCDNRSLISLDFAAFYRNGFIIVVRCDTGGAFGLLQRLEEMDWSEIDLVNSHVLTLSCWDSCRFLAPCDSQGDAMLFAQK